MSPQERKARSEKLLSALGVEVNPHLPVIESERVLKARLSEDIARRAICLTAVTSRAYGDDKSSLMSYLRKKSCLSSLSSEERGFMQRVRLSKEEKIKYSWQIEALRVLLWSIGYLTLKPLSFTPCKPGDVYANCSSKDNDGARFISEAKVLRASELLNLSDLVYRAHWATRQRSLDGTTKIGGVDPGVVLEYHRAINWITRYENQEWDDVTTDT